MNIVLNKHRFAFPADLKAALEPVGYSVLKSVCSQALGDQIIFVTRPDKKKILFYNDKHCQFAVDEGKQ